MSHASPNVPSADRRDFLKATLAVTLAGGPFGALAVASPSTRRVGPNGKLAVAKIACGGMGAADLAEVAKHPDVVIVGLCDVDGNTLDGVGKDDKGNDPYKGTPKFRDWRQMLGNLGDKVDAVVISTPDHSHALASLEAMRMKKHVYTQKPLARSAGENRLLAESAKVNPTLVTQMGTQRSARSSRRFAYELVKRGVVGKIRAMHAWTDRPAGWWPSGQPRPTGNDPVPEWLSWDLWLGPAPVRPYVSGAYHPFKWRGTRDFGTGAFGDMACHILDLPFYALGLGYPTEVHCDAPDGTDDQYPNQETVRMKFAPTPMTASDGCELVWFDGGRLPDWTALGLSSELAPSGKGLPTDNIKPLPNDGAAILVGDAGVLVIPIEGELAFAFIDGKLTRFDKSDDRPNGIEVPKSTNHWHDWVDACLGRGKARAPFELAGLLCEALAVGAVASRYVGRTMTYDPKQIAFVGEADSKKFLAPSWRTGW